MLLLLLLIAFTVFVFPVLPYGQTARFLLDVLMTLVLLTGVFAVSEHRRILPTLAALSILAIVLRWAEWIVPFALLSAVRELSMTVVLMALAIAVGINVFGAGKEVGARLMGAVVLYLLIGLEWGVIYSILYSYWPGAFAGALDAAGYPLERWIYFSFVTLTTVGYGDITPVTTAARSLAILEALVGQLYPAVILARLVSLPPDPRRSGDSQP